MRMKKVKIMLWTLGIVAITGGALAFKARFSAVYCTAAVAPGGACPDGCWQVTTGVITDNGIGAQHVCITDLDHCNENCQVTFFKPDPL